MNLNSIERAFSLIIAVLMVTTAFIPAVGATEPSRAASSVSTAADSFSGTTTFTADTSKATSGTASNGHGATKAEKDPPLFSEDNWSQPTSWTNTSVEIENTGKLSVDASPAAGTTRVVTGSGKTKLKVYDRETRTIRIKDDSRSAATGGDDELEIRLVNATPDLGTFTEIFEITAHRTIALDGSEDFLATWALYGGNENATRAEWFVWKEQSHSIEIPIIEYREVTLENITPEDTLPGSVTLDNVTPEDAILEGVLLDSIADADGTLESITLEDTTPVSVVLENATPDDAILEEVALDGTTPVDVALGNVSPEGVTPEDVVLEDVAPEYTPSEDVSPEDAVLGTVREPYIAGTETVEQSWPEWVPFVPDGQTLNAGETLLFKVIYTKPAEIGQVDINTAPVFRGVACQEMTLWSTAWAYRVPINVTNPPSIDGYPHREIVSFRTGMQSDFDDVRFVAANGTVLDYWKETYTASDSAAIWVNLPAGTTSIWMYYGNEAATDTGSRDNAYILYDDFNGPVDTALWLNQGLHYFSNGWIYDNSAAGSGPLVSRDDVITNGEPVIVEMHIHVDSLPSDPDYFCGRFPFFLEGPPNGLDWFADTSSRDRGVYSANGFSYRPGPSRGLSAGGDYYNTWIVTPYVQTHTVSGSATYTDVFFGPTRIDTYPQRRMLIFDGDNSAPGRVIRMDWIRVRKYVETEPAFTYDLPETAPFVATIAVTPSYAELVVGETVQFTATAYDQNGTVMDGVGFTWTSGNETIGTVTTDGIFSARYNGTSEVSASIGLISGTAQVTVTLGVTAGPEWNWSTDGWTGWAHTASWTRATGPCSEYGPVVVDGHGEHGADVSLARGAMVGTVEHEFTDPSGVGWDSLTLVARVPGTDVPSGRWMTIEVNGEVVYSESGFDCTDPANLVPKEFHADFPRSETVRVKISHGQNPAWIPRFIMEYYSLELESHPAISIISPSDDTVSAGGNVTVAGTVADTAITSLTLIHNNVSSTIPAQGGNFSTEVTLADANAIAIGGTDSLGNPFSTTLLLDGDMLPAAYEQEIGFDPLNADSNCSQWSGDQSGNGVIDGYEVFAGDLPVFAKYRIGADPFVVDTDRDGLTDSFELLKLGTFPEEPGQMLMMGEGDPVVVAAGTDDDPDGDGLSNFYEQLNRTDPLSADTDDDGLSDADEILIWTTDPCDADTDDDGLTDGAEVSLGANSQNSAPYPRINDSNGNGVLDGDEDYWSGERFLNETLNLTVFGRGYAIANVSVAEVNYTHLISEEILVSKVYDLGFGDNVSSGTIEIAYDPTYVENASLLSIYRFDEDLGTFVNVSSTVDSENWVVSCAVAGSAKYAVLDSARWDALFEDPLGVSSTMETTNSLGEELTAQVSVPPEALVEDVDYGVAFYDEPPAWYLEALEAEALEGASNEVVESEEENVSESVLLDVVTDGSYQAVANGDFWSGQQAWAPSDPYYPSTDDGGAEVDTYQNDYTSPQSSLKINVWAEANWRECTVAHANVDLTNVNTLTFRYKCIESVNDGNLESSGLRFWVEGYGDPLDPDFRTTASNEIARVTPSWQTATVDASGMTGQRTICFRVFVSVNSSSGTSTLTYLIDDVSAWSSEPTCNPNTANVRFHVKDSLNYAGVPNAEVTCEGVEETTDSRGNTYDFFVTEPGELHYQITSAGYKDHYGCILISPDDLGTSRVERIAINSISTATGELYVSSMPDNAEIYVDGTYNGRTNGHIWDVLAQSGYNQHTVEVRKDGYDPVSRIVTVNASQNVSVHFDLTAPTGTIAVTSSPPGAAVYLDTAYQGTTSSTSGQLTLPGVPVGAHRVDVLKEGYAPYTTTVTVADSQTAPVTATLTDEDLDEDGLPDGFESGYRDGFGNWHILDPDTVDTDGDGLSDGYETSRMVIDTNGKTYFKQRSDPNKVDTDEDGLDDWDEDYLGTNPLNPDTDGDLIRDGDDDAPFTPVYISAPVNQLIERRDLTAGAIFGETGILGGSMNWLVGDEVASSPAYFVGWMASGYFAVGDARDGLEALYQGDTIGAGLNALGIVPFVGDGERSVNALRKVVTKYPSRVAFLGRYLLKTGIVQRVPDELLQVRILDNCFDGGATALRNLNVPMARILEVGKVDGIHLARHAEALEIVRGSSRVPDPNIEGHVAEIIAEQTVLKTLYPGSVYTFYSDVELLNVYQKKLGEIDTVIVRDDHVVAIVQTKMGRTAAAAADARNQIDNNINLIDERLPFYSTNKPDLTPAKFRFVELDTVTIGPKDNTGFDHVVEYTNRELHELYKTIRG